MNEYTLDNMAFPCSSSEMINLKWNGVPLQWYHSKYWDGELWLVEPTLVRLIEEDFSPGAERNPSETLKNLLIDELQPIFDSEDWMGVIRYVNKKYTDSRNKALKGQLKKYRIVMAVTIILVALVVIGAMVAGLVTN